MATVIFMQRPYLISVPALQQAQMLYINQLPFFLYAYKTVARLAQSVERKTLNLVVVGSSPTVGTSFFKEALMIETIDFSGHLEYKSVQRQLGRAV